MSRAFWLIALGLGLFAGCASSNGPATRPSGIRERQERALKDPMNYSPEMGHQDISGGGLMQTDREGLRRDLDSVLNP